MPPPPPASRTPSGAGQAYKVKRFHAHKGELLVEQVNTAARRIQDIAAKAVLNNPENTRIALDGIDLSVQPFQEFESAGIPWHG